MQKQILFIAILFPHLSSCIMIKEYTYKQTPYTQVINERTGPFHRQKSTINGICEGISYAYRYGYGSLSENKYVKKLKLACAFMKKMVSLHPLLV